MSVGLGARRTRSFVYPRVGGTTRWRRRVVPRECFEPPYTAHSRLPVKSVSAGKTVTRTGDVRVCVSRAKNNKQGVKTFGAGCVYHNVCKRIYPFCRPSGAKTLRVDAGFSSFCCWFSGFFFFLFTSRRRRHSEIEILRKAAGVCTGAKGVLGNKLNSRPKSVSNALLIRVRSRYGP